MLCARSKCSSCRICKWVSAVYAELKDNYFFDFDKDSNKQPVLWKIFSAYLNKKKLPVLVKIEIAQSVSWV